MPSIYNYIKLIVGKNRKVEDLFAFFSDNFSYILEKYSIKDLTFSV